MGSGRDVCEQVLFHILLYLPVISLLRFKTVCKSWYSIIESSNFITQHFSRSSEKSHLIIQGYNGDLSILSGRKYELCSNLDFKSIYPMYTVDIINSCNGIVCVASRLSNDYWFLSLWNPAIKQVRQLPQSSFLDSFSDRSIMLVNTFAIGFDVKTNDYKVVSMSLDLGRDGLLKDSLVQVYSLRSDSWRIIHRGDDFPIAWIDICVNVVHNRGMCLWIGGPPSKPAVIFYVDLMGELYGTMSLPKENSSVPAQSLAFVNDKVTYIKCKLGEPCNFYEIWTMNEFGVNESWSRTYKLDDSFVPRVGISFANLLNNGKFILTKKLQEGFWENELSLLDVITEEEKLLNIQDAHTVTSYSESLVSLKRTT